MAYDAINAIIGIEKKAQEIIAPASKAQAEFENSLKAEKEKTYILVAHNGIARVVQPYFTDMTNEEFAGYGVKNCEVVRYDF